MLIIILWIMIATQMFGMWATVYMIGKPKVPTTPSVAAVGVVMSLIYIVTLVLVIVELSR